MDSSIPVDRTIDNLLEAAGFRDREELRKELEHAVDAPIPDIEAFIAPFEGPQPLPCEQLERFLGRLQLVSGIYLEGEDSTKLIVYGNDEAIMAAIIDLELLPAHAASLNNVAVGWAYLYDFDKALGPLEKALEEATSDFPPGKNIAKKRALTNKVILESKIKPLWPDCKKSREQ